MRQGRVFALVLGDTQNAETVVSGILPICSQNAYVLIDSGSTHSFISAKFAEKINRKLEPLDYVLSVSTPSGRSMNVASIYRACVVMIGNVELLADLMPLDITHFDVILGMDWLVANHAFINCVFKSVTLKPSNLAEVTFQGKGVVSPPYLISSMKAYRLIQKGCQGYLCSILSELNRNVELADIPVVGEFPDVFPNNLPGHLVDREIKFTVDVMSGTQPISKTPYRMAPAKLKELKL